MAVSYSPELIDKICTLMATSYKSIRTCCQENGTSYEAFRLWTTEGKSEFKEYALASYTRAKDDQIQHLSDEILRLSYEMQQLIRDGKTYNEFNVSAAVQALRVQIDSLKWILSKLAPKKFGDRLDITSNEQTIKQAIIIGGQQIDL